MAKILLVIFFIFTFLFLAIYTYYASGKLVYGKKYSLWKDLTGQVNYSAVFWKNEEK